VIALAFLAKAALWIAGVSVGVLLAAWLVLRWGIASTDEARGRRGR
jgi:hypothetical protein